MILLKSIKVELLALLIFSVVSLPFSCNSGSPNVSNTVVKKDTIFMLDTLEVKTILNYGAVRYNSREEALQGGNSIHNAELAMLKETGVIIYPGSGWFYKDQPVVLDTEGNSVSSIVEGNRTVNIVTNKPIDMFVGVIDNVMIRGFKAHYIGQFNKPCSVVRLGSPLNKGKNYTNHLGTYVKNFRPNRTNAVNYYLDFDVEGEYNVIPIWQSYDAEYENTHSHNHFMVVRGNYRKVDRAIKFDRKMRSQSTNTMDIKIRVWGANSFAEIKGINFATIEILGQELKPNNIPLFDIEGVNLDCNIFVYDVAKYNRSTGYMGRVSDPRSGLYNVNGLRLFGKGKDKTQIINGKPSSTGINFNESVLK